MSNFIVNAVTRIAGIRNPTLEMLKRAGINPGAVGAVDYSGSGKTQDESKQPINEAQTKKLWATFKGRNLGDDNILKEIIGRDPWKYTSSRDIQRGHFNAILKAVEEYKPANGNGERQPGEEG